MTNPDEPFVLEIRYRLERELNAVKSKHSLNECYNMLSSIYYVL